MDGIEQQLEYISNAMDSINDSTYELSQNNNNNDSFSGIGLIIVMNNGQIVEQGSAYDVINNPKNDYTKLLLSSYLNN